MRLFNQHRIEKERERRNTINKEYKQVNHRQVKPYKHNDYYQEENKGKHHITTH